MLNFSKVVKNKTTGNEVAHAGSPYVYSDEKHQCIFIHVPKVAGVSISNCLFGIDNQRHRKIKEYKNFDRVKFKNYFKFAFVRNPWDRFLSAYSYLKNGGRNAGDKRWSELYLKNFDRFDVFVKALKNEELKERVFSWQHFEPQYKYICDNRLNIEVDFVGRFENLQEDFKFVSDKLGVSMKLEHLNKSEHEKYDKYYDDETRDIIYKLYEADIKLFNYAFENSGGENLFQNY